ncbi:MAG TPA: hypothetical protein VG028_13460 [Terriglobia bacterium]|nr:hypothetical protein [Terriglobia bacterium]
MGGPMSGAVQRTKSNSLIKSPLNELNKPAKCALGGATILESYLFDAFTHPDPYWYLFGFPEFSQALFLLRDTPLTGHFVIAYSGNGAYQAIDQNGNQIWLSVWDFYICFDSAPGKTPGFHGIFYNRGAPPGGHAQLQPGQLQQVDGRPIAGTWGAYNIDPIGNGPTGAAAWPPPSWPSYNPPDASRTELGAQMLCLAAQFIVDGAMALIAYIRSGAYSPTVVKGQGPSFRLYKIMPTINLLFYWIDFDDNSGLMVLLIQLKNVSALWQFVTGIFVKESIVQTLQGGVIFHPNNEMEFKLPWPNSAPPLPAINGTLQISDWMTDEIASTFPLAMAPNLVADIGHWMIALNAGGGVLTIDVWVKNLGNAAVTGAKVAISGDGISEVTVNTSIYAGFLYVPAQPSGPNAPAVDTRSIIEFTATFAKAATTVQASITYGGFIWQLQWQLTGLPVPP